MPIKFIKKTPPIQEEPTVAPDPVKKLIRLRVIPPDAQPQDFTGRKLVVVQPQRYRETRAGIRQHNVIRYDETGKGTISPYVESSWGSESRFTEPVRSAVSLFCRMKLHYTVSLLACHHYCARPCEDHLRVLTEQGWLRIPPPVSRADHGTISESDMEALSKKKKVKKEAPPDEE